MAPVRVDLHNHTAFSPDGVMAPLQFLRAAAARGLHCVAVTDHDTLKGALACAELAAADARLPRVIPGEEIRTTGGEIIGLFLSEEIPGGLSSVETVSMIRQQGGIVYLPHPLDGVRVSAGSGWRTEETARLVDVIEVNNGRSMRRSYGRAALRLAARTGSLLGAGSDAHFEAEVGRSYMVVSSIPDRLDFLDVLRTGRPSPDLSGAALLLGWAFCGATGMAKVARSLRRSRLRRSGAGT